MFLLKKGRLLDFVLELHASCTMLHAVIKRDVINEIDDTLPRSSLPQFEEMFTLPLPCEEQLNENVPPRIRTGFLFFLAEMSLRTILQRILTTPGLGNSMQDTSENSGCVSGFKLSPLILELRYQLDTWILQFPIDLNWSVEPGCGVLSGVGTRLKLLYWYARFSLLKPMMLSVLQDQTIQSTFILWEPFREALLPALTMVKVFIEEGPDIDVLMANSHDQRIAEKE
ncbi:hypothetical protein DV737_g1350, partial [Chaetothyriales sp. CBS 132003]